jgi:hypothetical protein
MAGFYALRCGGRRSRGYCSALFPREQRIVGIRLNICHRNRSCAAAIGAMHNSTATRAF